MKLSAKQLRNIIISETKSVNERLDRQQYLAAVQNVAEAIDALHDMGGAPQEVVDEVRALEEAVARLARAVRKATSIPPPRG